jgi:photosystem II stability/assembly factor-like uncharacterized protein
MMRTTKRTAVSNSIALYTIALFACLLASCTTGRTPNVKVQFVNPNAGWIVGPRLLATQDGGKTWIELRRDGLGTIQAEEFFQGQHWIQFTSPETGWSVGGSGVAKTTDGGRTWTSIVVTDGEDESLQSLFFISPNEGWVVGASVYHSRDGGQSWERLSHTPAGDVLRQRNRRISPSFANYKPALWLKDATNGFMARLDGEVYATSDSGKTWKIIWQVDKRINDIFFVNEHAGWIVGSDGLVARTCDGGWTWSSASAPTKADLINVFFINTQIGWAVGTESTILFTKDGGLTWKSAAVSGVWGSPPLASVNFSNELDGWVVGGYGDPMRPSLLAPSNVILTTKDGGQTWRSVRP